MDTKDFQSWCRKKAVLHSVPDEKTPYFHERELWWCALGANVGFEQDGKNENFERPVLILRKFNRYLLLAVPQTSREKEGKFFYKVTRDGKNYFLVLSQIRVISSKRLLRKLGMISEKDFEKVRQEVKTVSI